MIGTVSLATGVQDLPFPSLSAQAAENAIGRLEGLLLRRKPARQARSNRRLASLEAAFPLGDASLPVNQALTGQDAERSFISAQVNYFMRHRQPGRAAGRFPWSFARGQCAKCCTGCVAF